jgi:hypothetical protein
MDIFDLAGLLADKYPQATWIQGRVNGKLRGFEIKRGKGLELTVDIYAL